jgi:hypothetical protein
MLARVVRSAWFWNGVLTAGALIALYYAFVGFPATPMTVAEANRLFAKGLRSGQSREEAERWLASHGIPPRSLAQPGGTCYDITRRRDDVTFKGWWMIGRGNRTVAECAGLDVDVVQSVICVIYPDAGRRVVGSIEITVYVFFDADRRLIRHWVDEFHLSL